MGEVCSAEALLRSGFIAHAKKEFRKYNPKVRRRINASQKTVTAEMSPLRVHKTQVSLIAALVSNLFFKLIEFGTAC